MKELTSVKVKKLMTYKVVPENEEWRTKLVDEILGAKYGDLTIDIDDNELNDILSFPCSS